jgi:hypothetical protein
MRVCHLHTFAIDKATYERSEPGSFRGVGGSETLVRIITGIGGRATRYRPASVPVVRVSVGKQSGTVPQRRTSSG